MMERIGLITLSVIDGQGQRLQVITLQQVQEDVSFEKCTVISSPKGKSTSSVCDGSAESSMSQQESSLRQQVKMCKIHAHMDPMLASCIIATLQRSMNFRHAFMILLQRHCRNRTVLLGPRTHLHLKLKLLYSHMQYFTMEPDIRWSDKMLPLWTIRLVIEDAFSWLSTLGGAYSALGEQFTHCAIEAGRLSLRQLKLAYYLGDPFLQAKCFIYLALSLMQRGFLKHAKDIIRHQYRFAISCGEWADTRLIAMCHGVWCHLKYHKLVRRQTRDKLGKKTNSRQQNGTSRIDSMVC